MTYLTIVWPSTTIYSCFNFVVFRNLTFKSPTSKVCTSCMGLSRAITTRKCIWSHILTNNTFFNLLSFNFGLTKSYSSLLNFPHIVYQHTKYMDLIFSSKFWFLIHQWKQTFHWTAITLSCSDFLSYICFFIVALLAYSIFLQSVT